MLNILVRFLSRAFSVLPLFLPSSSPVNITDDMWAEQNRRPYSHVA